MSTRDRDEHTSSEAQAATAPAAQVTAPGLALAGAIGNRAFASAVAARGGGGERTLGRDFLDTAIDIGLGAVAGPFAGPLLKPTVKALADQARGAPPGAHKGVTGITDVRAQWGVVLTDTVTGSEIKREISPQAPFVNLKQEMDASVGPGRYTVMLKLNLATPSGTQSLNEVSWRVRVAPDGKATIEADALQTVSPTVGNDVMLTGLNAATNVATERSGFSINPQLTGPSGSSSVTGGGQVGVEVPPASGGASGSATVGVNTPNVTLQRGLRLNLETKPARATKHTAHFKINEAVLLEGEIEKMRKWYKLLDDSLRKQIEDGTLDLFVTGFASTTGKLKNNQQLAKDRAAEVARFVVQFTSTKAKIVEGSEGELAQREQKGEDDTERDEFRRADITVGTRF